jgi:hypothetical protein
MNKKIGLTVIILAIALQSFSQIKPFRFGVYVAPNISWLSPDSEDYQADGSNFGFSWGFISDIAITENYFVKTGFSVDYLGGGLKFPYQNSELAEGVGIMYRDYKLRYLTIPVTLKLRTNKFDKIAYYGNIGFGTSFNLKSKGKDEFVTENGTFKPEGKTDVKDETTFVKGSLIVGGGAEYFLDESTSLLVELSFNNGLSNVLKGTNTVDPNVKQKANLYYFQLSIGVMF